MLPIKEITSTTDKVRRISSGFVQFENEKVLLPKKHSELENFIKEYVNFPHRKYHDDMLDSLELTLQLTRTPVYDLDVYGLIVGDYDYEDDYY
jgi:predicted phage terminase large subunit-like protein